MMCFMLQPSDIIVDAPADDEVVDPQAWFDSPGPVEIEIGCGKGGFLLSRARADADVRILGIEWANKYFLGCADRMARWNLSNVRVMRADASHFFQHNLPEDSITALHVYHPDPWPKKRHHKRRLIQPPFVEAALRALRPGGTWLIQSDHEEYFQHIEALLGQRDELSSVPWSDLDHQRDADWKGTNFEIKYTQQGRTIHRLAYRVQSPVLTSAR